MSGNRSKSAFFEGWWVTLSADFRGKGASPTNHCWCQKTRVIAVSCSIKIFAVRCLILSQYTHLTDRQTDRQTDRRTELRQQYPALHYMQSHGKNAVVRNSVYTFYTGCLVGLYSVCYAHLHEWMYTHTSLASNSRTKSCTVHLTHLWCNFEVKRRTCNVCASHSMLGYCVANYINVCSLSVNI